MKVVTAKFGGPKGRGVWRDIKSDSLEEWVSFDERKKRQEGLFSLACIELEANLCRVNCSQGGEGPRAVHRRRVLGDST